MKIFNALINENCLGSQKMLTSPDHIIGTEVHVYIYIYIDIYIYIYIYIYIHIYIYINIYILYIYRAIEL